jgi:hypothetical protein
MRADRVEALVDQARVDVDDDESVGGLVLGP